MLALLELRSRGNMLAPLLVRSRIGPPPISLSHIFRNKKILREFEKIIGIVILAVVEIALA